MRTAAFLQPSPLDLSTEFVFEVLSQRLTRHADGIEHGCNRGRKINEDRKPEIAVTDDAQEDQYRLDDKGEERVFDTDLTDSAGYLLGDGQIVDRIGNDDGIRVFGAFVDANIDGCVAVRFDSVGIHRGE